MKLILVKGALSWENTILHHCKHQQNAVCSVTYFYTATIMMLKIMHGFHPLLGHHVLFKFALFDITGLLLCD